MLARDPRQQLLLKMELQALQLGSSLIFRVFQKGIILLRMCLHFVILIQRTSRLAPHLCRIVCRYLELHISKHPNKHGALFCQSCDQTSQIWHTDSSPIQQTFQQPPQVLGMVPLTSFQRLSEGQLLSRKRGTMKEQSRNRQENSILCARPQTAQALLPFRNHFELSGLI